MAVQLNREQIACDLVASETPVFSTRKNPFAEHEDPLEHMLALLLKEAGKSGITFSAEEEEILRSERDGSEPVPHVLREKSTRLIERVLINERTNDSDKGPKSFRNSLQWAGDRAYPNIVALSEEVIMSGGFGTFPLQGRRLVMDRISLFVCALLAILFMVILIALLSVLFDRK